MSEPSSHHIGREQLRTAMAEHLRPIGAGDSPGLIVTKGRESDVVVTSPESFIDNRLLATEGVIARKLWDLKDRNQHPSGPALVSAREFTGLTLGKEVELAFYADAWTEAHKRIKQTGSQPLKKFLASPYWQFDLPWVLFEGHWVYSVVEAGMKAPAFIVVGRGSDLDQLTDPIIAAVIDLPDSLRAAWAMGPAAEIS